MAATVRGPRGYFVFDWLSGSPVAPSPVETDTAKSPLGLTTTEKLPLSERVHPSTTRLSRRPRMVLAQARMPGSVGGSFGVQLLRASSPARTESRIAGQFKPSPARRR